MKFIYNGKANYGGVYRIVNITNERVYIGSTYRFKTRASGHYSDLQKQRHKNKFLQNDFNKCGKDAFVFEVLEVVETNEKDRLQKEQFFIDQNFDNQKQCYNLEKKAGFTRKNKGNKDPYNPETDKRTLPKTVEWIKTVSAKNKDFWSNDENKILASINAMKRWKNYSANVILVNILTKEEVIITTSVRQFALEKNLSYKSLHQLIKRKTKSCGGWCLKDKDFI